MDGHWWWSKHKDACVALGGKGWEGACSVSESLITLCHLNPLSAELVPGSEAQAHTCWRFWVLTHTHTHKTLISQLQLLSVILLCCFIARFHVQKIEKIDIYGLFIVFGRCKTGSVLQPFIYFKSFQMELRKQQFIWSGLWFLMSQLTISWIKVNGNQL